MKSKWIESEDSFLAYFGSVEDYKSTRRYYWKNGPWAKFNFVRIKPGVSLQDESMISEVKESINFFKSKSQKFYVKSHFDFDQIGSIPLKHIGTPIVYNVNSLGDFKSRSELNVSLVEVVNEEDFKRWWIVNSGGRNRDNPFESPIYNSLKEYLKNNKTHFYILCHEGHDVTCVGVSEFKYGINIWGLATLPDFQGRGYAKKTLSLLENSFELDCYSQSNLGSISTKMFAKGTNYSELYIEKCYEVFD